MPSEAAGTRRPPPPHSPIQGQCWRVSTPCVVHPAFRKTCCPSATVISAAKGWRRDVTLAHSRARGHGHSAWKDPGCHWQGEDTSKRVPSSNRLVNRHRALRLSPLPGRNAMRGQYSRTENGDAGNPEQNLDGRVKKQYK